MSDPQEFRIKPLDGGRFRLEFRNPKSGGKVQTWDTAYYANVLKKERYLRGGR